MSEVNITCLYNNWRNYLFQDLNLLDKFGVLPGYLNEDEKEIVEILKQLADYDINAETVRKIERKYNKSWF